MLDTLALVRVAAALTLDAGDATAARAWLEAHDRWLDWSEAVLGRSEGHLLWSAVHRTTGDLAAAIHEAEEAVSCASAPRQPLALLAGLRVLGELAVSARRAGQAATYLTHALALADACAAPFERSSVLLALAELRILQGERAEARRLWRRCKRSPGDSARPR